MGRLPTKNKNLPPHMRKRVQKSGKTFFYLDTGGRPRKEIPLGNDYFLALKKYADLNQSQRIAAGTFGDVMEKYISEELPNLAKNTRKTHSSDIKHLKKYFTEAPIDEIKPMHLKKFLNLHKHIPTTANRCKRLFSTIWNHARGWGYTDLENPCAGITGFSLGKRNVYITDAVLAAVYKFSGEALRDALDLAYLSGQRPSDALKIKCSDFEDGLLTIVQDKTGKILRISVTGKLAELHKRIMDRKSHHKTENAQLLMNRDGKPFTLPALRSQFEKAREKAATETPNLADAIKKFWFYDLRAKAADDTSEMRGEQAASDLLGHENVRTTQRHYLRKGKIVAPTK
jgi:integrase